MEELPIGSFSSLYLRLMGRHFSNAWCGGLEWQEVSHELTTSELTAPENPAFENPASQKTVPENTAFENPAPQITTPEYPPPGYDRHELTTPELTIENLTRRSTERSSLKDVSA